MAATRAVSSQRWLDAPSQALQQLVRGAYAAAGAPGKTVKDFFNGVWLGHPLHPVLTGVAIGAWSAALLLDTLQVATRRRSFGTGADAAVALGMGGALSAAVAGLTDWQYLTGRPRRVGLVHAAVNVAATTLYGASWIMRGSRRRRAGRALGLAGYLTVMVGGYLGGHLVFDQQVGVKHTPAEPGPDQFVPALPVSELADGHLRRAEVRGQAILLVRRGERIFAMLETCSHLGGPLSEGWLVEDSVVCPWHQSRYRLADGHVLDGPSAYDQPCFETRVRNGLVEIRARPPIGARQAASERV